MDDSNPTLGLTIRRVALDSLHLDPANARAHGDSNMDAIEASLQRFGQAEPLVVHKETGRVIGEDLVFFPASEVGENWPLVRP